MPEQIIVGICRFSFLGRSDIAAWRGGSAPLAALRSTIAADLFARPRLERRLQSFRHLCLASIRAQSDQRFIFLVLTSPELPDWALRRLHELCAACENVEMIVSDAPMADEALAVPLATIASGGGQLVQFRLDDDDALNLHFIARLRAHAARMADLPGFAVSFSRSLAVSIYPGHPTRRWMINRPFVAAGLAARLPAGRGLFSYPHFAMRKELTSITDLDLIGALVLKWPSDSRQEVVGQPRFGYRSLEEEEFARYLRRGFPFLRGFDFETLRVDAAGEGAMDPPSAASAQPQGEA